MPATLGFEEAATVLTALAGAVLPLCNQDDGASSVRLTPPWLEDGRQKYAGKPTLILGGATAVGQYGACPTFGISTPPPYISLILPYDSHTSRSSVWVLAHHH